MKTFGDYKEPIPEHLQETADTLLSRSLRLYGNRVREGRRYVNHTGDTYGLGCYNVAGCCGMYVIAGFLYEKSAPTSIDKNTLELMRWCMQQAIKSAIDMWGGKGTRYIVNLTLHQARIWAPALAAVGFTKIQKGWTNRRTSRKLRTFYLDL